MKKAVKEILILGSVLMVIFFGSFMVMGSGGVAEFFDIDDEDSELIETEKEEEASEAEEPKIEEESFKVQSFTGLLIGFDKSQGLTDVIMLAHFDAEKNNVKLMSVPRDLMIDFRKEPFKSIKENDPNNRLGYLKMTEIYMGLGGGKEALLQVEKVISAIVGMDIDYLATIDVDGFTEVVDIIGGVEFDVPQRMKYSDPLQDLYIDLQKGPQLLDGEHAMQLVRFRKYPEGDIQRTRVQQALVLEVYKKILGIRDFDKIAKLTSSVYGIFNSDFGLKFALDYAGYFFEQKSLDLLDPNNMVTLPSYGIKIDEIWYQEWDIEEVQAVVKELLER
jgi:polyisoprenyl-teichoic acid--peptidoglycan teichoic acid transferase